MRCTARPKRRAYRHTRHIPPPSHITAPALGTYDCSQHSNDPTACTGALGNCAADPFAFNCKCKYHTVNTDPKRCPVGKFIFVPSICHLLYVYGEHKTRYTRVPCFPSCLALITPYIRWIPACRVNANGFLSAILTAPDKHWQSQFPASVT